MRLFLTLLLAAAALPLTTPAVAQEAAAPVAAPIAADIDASGDSITIGGGVATVPDYEGSDNNRIIPMAAARGSLSGYSFSTRGTRLFVDLARTDPGPVWDYQLGPVVSLNLNRTGKIEDDRIVALGKRKVALELGGYVGIGKTGVITSEYDKVSVSLSYIHDVTGIHDSSVLTPQIDYGTPLSRKAYVGISGSASYVGEGYADTYFGVTPPGTIGSGLPGYDPDSGWKNWSVSALGSYAITGDLLGGLSAVAGLSYSRLLGDFARSPVTGIAGDKSQWFGAVGLAYTF